MLYEESRYEELEKELITQCSQCCGICCVALCFAKSEGFPRDKESGKACNHLTHDFSCTIHAALAERKMKGCMAYDCMGAGQKVTQVIYKGLDWQSNPDIKEQMFAVFEKVYLLHQMQWYLLEASTFIGVDDLQENIHYLIEENERLTGLRPEEILNANMQEYQERVNQVLKQALEYIGVIKEEGKAGAAQKIFFGKNFKKANLDREDFNTALLIAADLERCSLKETSFLGADMRDANIKNTDLSKSLFLTQRQISMAKGNQNTKLPRRLCYPNTWNM